MSAPSKNKDFRFDAGARLPTGNPPFGAARPAPAPAPAPKPGTQSEYFPQHKYPQQQQQQQQQRAEYGVPLKQQPKQLTVKDDDNMPSAQQSTGGNARVHSAEHVAVKREHKAKRSPQKQQQMQQPQQQQQQHYQPPPRHEASFDAHMGNAPPQEQILDDDDERAYAAAAEMDLTGYEDETQYQPQDIGKLQNPAFENAEFLVPAQQQHQHQQPTPALSPAVALAKHEGVGFDSIVANIAVMQAQVSAVNEKNAQLESELHQARVDKAHFRDHLETCLANIDALVVINQAQVDELDFHEQRMNGLKASYELYQTILKKLETVVTDTRSTRVALNNKIENLMKELDRVKLEKEHLEQTCDELRDKEAKVEKQHKIAIEQMHKHLQEASQLIELKQNEYNKFSANLSSMNDQAKAAYEVARASLAKERAEENLKSAQRIAELEAAVTKADALVADLTARAEELQKSFDERLATATAAAGETHTAKLSEIVKQHAEETARVEGKHAAECARLTQERVDAEREAENQAERDATERHTAAWAAFAHSVALTIEAAVGAKATQPVAAATTQFCNAFKGVHVLQPDVLVQEIKRLVTALAKSCARADKAAQDAAARVGPLNEAQVAMRQQYLDAMRGVVGMVSELVDLDCEIASVDGAEQAVKDVVEAVEKKIGELEEDKLTVDAQVESAQKKYKMERAALMKKHNDEVKDIKQDFAKELKEKDAKLKSEMEANEKLQAQIAGLEAKIKESSELAAAAAVTSSTTTPKFKQDNAKPTTTAMGVDQPAKITSKSFVVQGENIDEIEDSDDDKGGKTIGPLERAAGGKTSARRKAPGRSQSKSNRGGRKGAPRRMVKDAAPVEKPTDQAEEVEGWLFGDRRV